MTETLTRDYLRKKLGQEIVVQGEEFEVMYENWSGRPGLWRSAGNLVRFLEVGEILKFPNGDERAYSSEIKI